MILVIVLYKGKEGTLWKDIVFVSEGKLETVLKDFPGRDNGYILWWLIDTNNIPSGYTSKDVGRLFLEVFSKDKGNDDYRAEFVVGFHDDVAKNRSWGLLK